MRVYAKEHACGEGVSRCSAERAFGIRSSFMSSNRLASSASAIRDAIVRMYRITPSKRTRGFPPTRVGYLDTHSRNDRRIAHIRSAIRDVRAGVPVEAHARGSL